MRALPFLALLTLAAGATAHAGRTIPPGCQEDYGTCKEDCTIEYGGNGRAVTKLTRCFQGCQESMDLCSARHSSVREMRDMGLPEDLADKPRKAKPDPALATPSSRRNAIKDKDKAREEDPFGDAESAPRRTSTNYDETFEDPPPRAAEKTERQGYRATAPGEEPAPSRDEAPARPEPAAVSSPGEPAPPMRQGVYRASDAKPPPSPSPAMAPEPDEGLEPLADTKPAAPAPKPAPEAPKAPPARPTVTASPAEKDPLLDEEPPPPPPVVKKPEPVPSSRPALPPEPKNDISDWDPGD